MLPRPSLGGDALVLLLFLLFCSFMVFEDKESLKWLFDFYGRLPPDTKTLIHLRTVSAAVGPREVSSAAYSFAPPCLVVQLQHDPGAPVRRVGSLLGMPLPPAPPYQWTPFPPSQPLRSSPVTLGTGSALYPAGLGPRLNLATDSPRPTEVSGAHPRDVDAPGRSYSGGR